MPSCLRFNALAREFPGTKTAFVPGAFTASLWLCCVVVRGVTIPSTKAAFADIIVDAVTGLLRGRAGVLWNRTSCNAVIACQPGAPT